jgi:hypothetical protein
VAIAVSGDRPRLRALWTGLASVITFGLVASMYPRVLDGEEPTLRLGALAPGVDVVLRVDAAGMMFAASAAALWILASSYSIGYVHGADEGHRTRFFATFAVCVSTTMGLAFAGNLFTFFVFYELLTLATYPLVVHKQTPAAFAAGKRYLLTLLGGGTALLLAVVIVQVNVPDASFVAGGVLGSPTTGGVSDVMVIGLVVLSLLGFGTKAAVMPLARMAPAGDGRAHPGECTAARRRRRQGRRVRVRSDVRLRDRPGTSRRHRHRRGGGFDRGGDDRDRVGHRVPPGPTQATARLLHHRPPLLHRARGVAAVGVGMERRDAPPREPRGAEDHPLLRCRGDLRDHRRGPGVADGRHRPADATHHGGVRRRGARSGRVAPVGGSSASGSWEPARSTPTSRSSR